MAHYFVNNAPTVHGVHMVHHVSCFRLPVDKRYLGNFGDVREALMEARKEFWQSGGCESCTHGPADQDTIPIEQLSLPWGSKITL